jgi:hypothetical protein
VTLFVRKILHCCLCFFAKLLQMARIRARQLCNIEASNLIRLRIRETTAKRSYLDKSNPGSRPKPFTLNSKSRKQRLNDLTSTSQTLAPDPKTLNPIPNPKLEISETTHLDQLDPGTRLEWHTPTRSGVLPIRRILKTTRLRLFDTPLSRTAVGAMCISKRPPVPISPDLTSSSSTVAVPPIVCTLVLGYLAGLRFCSSITC